MKIRRLYESVSRPWGRVSESEEEYTPVTNSELIAFLADDEDFKLTDDGTKIVVVCDGLVFQLGIVSDEIEPTAMELFTDLTEDIALERNLRFELTCEVAPGRVSPEELTRAEAAFDAAQRLVHDRASRLTTDRLTLYEALRTPRPSAAQRLDEMWIAVRKKHTDFSRYTGPRIRVPTLLQGKVAGRDPAGEAEEEAGLSAEKSDPPGRASDAGGGGAEPVGQ